MLIRINNPNDRAIGRRVFALERKARLLAPAPENQLAHPGAGGVHGNQWFALRREILIERLDDHQFAPYQRRILHRRDDRADYARKLHFS